MPSASDSNWRQKLCDMHVNKSKHFEKPRLSQTSFIVSHFADRVEYQIDGFVEKNRDTVLDEHINILKASQYELVAELFQDIPDIVLSPTRRAGVPVRPARELPKSSSQQKQSRKTVGSQFRESLNLLMETLFKTTPHYIRCIKPNDSKETFNFDPKRAVQQLRACGVLETIRISAAGYPSRWTYSEFFQRYRVLAHSKEILRNDMRKTCEKILHKLIQDRDKYQFGKTKIFFRAGQVAYLEHLRSERLRGCGRLIQKMVRGWLARRNYAKVRRMVQLVQTHGRGMLARRHALHIKRTQAAIHIQTTWRRYCQQQKYQRMLRAVIVIQSYARGSFGRQQFVEMRANAKAVIIQRIVRGWLARRRYMKVRRGFIKLQAHVRRHAAKKELKRLKVEAKSVEHMKNVARGLENKIIELQQKLTEKNKEVLLLRDDQHQLTEMKLEVTKLRTAVQTNKVSSDRIAELEKIIALLTAELEHEKQEKETIVEENSNMKKESQQLSTRLSEEKLLLEEELKRVNDLIQLKESEFDALLKAKLMETRESLMNEFDVERSHHQKLISDYTRLQQRFENLQDDVQVLTSPSAPVAPGNSPFSRPPQPPPAATVGKVPASGEVATSNGNDNGTESRPESRLENVPPNVGDFDEGATDVALVTRLQLRIKQLEWERTLMQREIDRKENASLHGSQSADEQERDIFEALKVQELEMQQTTALADLNAFRKAIADDNEEFIAKRIKGSNAAQQLISQFEVMQEELARRRDECIQLRTVLATQNRQISELAAGNAIVINEDAELAMAYRSQRDLNKLLENEIQKFQKEAKSREKELHQHIEELKKENTRQQRLISQNLTMTPQAKMEATMQHEITRLTSENLDLREEIDQLQDQIRKLKKALKIYAKRLKVTEATEVQEDLEREMATENENNMPAVKHYEQREYSGMFEYNKDDEIQLVKNLIIELKPRLAVQQLPGLPAYILFMCIRHTDYMNNDEKVRSLLTGTINGIKKTVKRHQEDCETLSLWLSNTCRLLHVLKQYSGEKVFQVANTPRQNDHCLRNFDLSEYRQILSDLAIWIFQGLIKLNQTLIHPIIVSAVLEHEAIAGLSAGKPTGLRGRAPGGASSSRASFSADDKNKDLSLDQLIKVLDGLMRVLTLHAVDPEIIQQIYRQLFYFICANALNNLLLRKDMCHWTKGMQMRYNLSHLEQWLRDNKLQDSNVQQALQPIIQASQLLQARKTDSDVDCICEMCSRLTMSQIIKILNLYTPVNEFEERVPISFIRKIQDKLSGRQDSSPTLLMDTKFFFAVTFPFNPSNVGLETIIVPVQWGLDFLKRV